VELALTRMGYQLGLLGLLFDFQFDFQYAFLDHRIQRDEVEPAQLKRVL